MGLDGVELIMEVENYFGISIPDAEAEKAYTVQILVDVVAKLLKLTDNGFELRDSVFEKVNQALLKLGLTNAPINLTEPISKYLYPHNKRVWEDLKDELQLDIPKPEALNKDSRKIVDKIKIAFNWEPMYDWLTITVEQFVAAICANNYEELLDRENVKNTYEIYIAITALTIAKIGVDYYEITPEKSFTTDLGMD